MHSIIWNQIEAAELLGIGRDPVCYKMERFGLVH
ncbi:MAG TPA: helix-turn-helix domain-containing protein [Candidatus Acidoferrum sp.]|nr:helix-turn-helix domain-containing protein [Candidatus Acidoferrum sp.]